MIDILSSARLPKLLKQAKVIANPKTSKDGFDPAHYQPISFVAECEIQVT
jgi:hypothetical protein